MEKEYPVYAEITTLGDYIDIVSTLKEEWDENRNDLVPVPYIWYRGQVEDKPLLPTVFRKDVNGKIYSEAVIQNMLNSHLENYTQFQFKDIVQQYTYAQHYGIPTRLLDWSESNLTALYFALAQHKNNPERAVIWILHTGKLNEVSLKLSNFPDYENIPGPFLDDNVLVYLRFKMIGHLTGKTHEELQRQFMNEIPEELKKYPNILDYPIAFYPSSIGNMRLSVQKGGFSVHGTKRIPIENMFQEGEYTNFLIKLIVNEDKQEKIFLELKNCGISPRILFPDIAGFAMELKGEEFKID